MEIENLKIKLDQIVKTQAVIFDRIQAIQNGMESTYKVNFKSQIQMDEEWKSYLNSIPKRNHRRKKFML